MNEVSCRIVRIFLGHARAAGAPVERLIAGIDRPIAELDDPRRRIDWSQFVRLVDNAHALWGEPGLEAIGQGYHRLLRLGPRPLARLFWSQRSVYHDFLRVRGVAAELIHSARGSIIDLDERHLVVEILLDEGYEHSSLVFVYARACLASLPLALGRPIADTTLTPIPGGGRFVIRLPRGGAPLAPVRRAVTWPRRVLAARRELRSVSGELLLRHRELEAQRAMLALQQTKLASANAIGGAVLSGFDVDGALGEITQALVEVAGFRGATLDCQLEHGARVVRRSATHGVIGPQPDIARTMTSRQGLEVNLALSLPDDVSVAERADYEELAAFLEPSIIAAVDNARAVNALEQQQRLLNQRLYELSRAREVADRSLRLKSEFVANMSHEIRTPLHGVTGTVQLLEGTRLDVEQRHYIELLKRSGQALLAVVNDVLDFSKIEAGKLHLDSVDFDPVAIAEEVADLFANEAEKKGIDLVCETHAADPMMLRGDPLRIRQVLTNLVSNAIKFTSKGSVQVRMTIDPGDEVSRLRIDVIDTGIGIDQVFAKTIFEPFVQADGSTTRRFGGTGLGLSITKQLCDIMGAQISLQSELGTGTTFAVEVFVPRSDARRRTHREAAVPEAVGIGIEASLAGRRAVIASDRVQTRSAIARALAPLGLEVSVAGTHDELVRLLRAAPPGALPVLIVDERLAVPGLVEQVKAVGPIPIVLAKLPPGAPPTAERDLCDALLSWPVRTSQVATRVVAAALRCGEWQVASRPRRARISGTFGAVRGRVEVAVLVVVPDPVARRIASHLLDRSGARVVAVASWNEGLERLADESFDAIVADPDAAVSDPELVRQAIARVRHGGVWAVALGDPPPDAEPGPWDRILASPPTEESLAALVGSLREAGVARVANLVGHA